MVKINLVTGNKGKWKEFKDLIGHGFELKQINFDLKEIQELDSKKVVKEKLFEADKLWKERFKNRKRTDWLMIEDTCLSVKSLGELPGPMIKWFLTSLGLKGLAELVLKQKNQLAIAKTTIGLLNHNYKMKFFEGVISGRIVLPRGKNGFGWDLIFQPDGSDKTFAQMDQKEKNMVSMRRLAVEKMLRFMLKNRS